MKDLSSLLTEIKLWWGVAIGIILLIIDKKLGPSEEDLPVPLKSILAVLCVAEIYLILHSNASLLEQNLFFAGVGVLVLAALYTYFSYVTTFEKVVDRPPPKWRFWNRNNRTETIKIVGGRLTPEARNYLSTNRRSINAYFMDVLYNEDLVWSRWSRGIYRIILFLLYSGFILAATACLVISAQTALRSVSLAAC